MEFSVILKVREASLELLVLGFGMGENTNLRGKTTTEEQKRVINAINKFVL
jgi:hypothetical protein